MVRKLIGEVEPLPTGYGIAYYDYLSRYVVCYPVPLNQVVRIGRLLWLWLKVKYTPASIDLAYCKGVRAGAAQERVHYRNMKARQEVVGQLERCRETGAQANGAEQQLLGLVENVYLWVLNQDDSA